MIIKAKPVNRVFITSEENAQKMLKSCDPAAMKRILKNAERVKQQFIKR